MNIRAPASLELRHESGFGCRIDGTPKARGSLLAQVIGLPVRRVSDLPWKTQGPVETWQPRCRTHGASSSWTWRIGGSRFPKSASARYCFALMGSSWGTRSAVERALRQPRLEETGLSNCHGSTPKAAASFSMLSNETFRSARSMAPTYVRCRSHTSAKASWLRPIACRPRRTFRATIHRNDSCPRPEPTPEASGVQARCSTVDK